MLSRNAHTHSLVHRMHIPFSGQRGMQSFPEEVLNRLGLSGPFTPRADQGGNQPAMAPLTTTSSLCLRLQSPFLHLLLLFLVSSCSGKSVIRFYREASCDSGTPSSGDAFETDDLNGRVGECFKPPAFTVALEIDELDTGCSSKHSFVLSPHDSLLPSQGLPDRSLTGQPQQSPHFSTRPATCPPPRPWPRPRMIPNPATSSAPPI
jgi:hypothetical protein